MLRDIKGPVYFSSDYSLLIILAVLVILAILVFLTRYFLKKRTVSRKSRLSIPTRSAHEIAYEALKSLLSKKFPQQGKVKEYYFELSNIARHYIENRFRLKAPEMTTEEFLFSLKESDILSGTYKNLLKKFLNLCDIVKFAKYAPNEEAIEKSFKITKKFVDETKGVAKSK